MAIYLNKRNNKRYVVNTYPTSSYCNGVAVVVEETTEDPSKPDRWGNDKSRSYVFDNIAALRNEICEYSIGHQGFKLADIDTGKWLDLITGTASRHFRIFRLDCGRVPAQYVMVRNAAVNGNLERLVTKYPLKNLRSYKSDGFMKKPSNITELDRGIKAYGTGSSITRPTTDQLIASLDAAINEPTSDTVNCSSLLTSASKSYYGLNVIPFKASMYNQPGTQHIVNAPYNRQQTYTDGMYWRGTYSQWGNFAHLCKDADTFYRWVWTSAYHQLMTYDKNPRPIMMWTDNLNHVNSVYDNVGNKILRLAHMQASGVTCIKTWGNNDLHFVVVPMLIGNPNHSMHDTAVAFFSATPLTLTDITKTQPPVANAKKAK